jgi:hypothetical protein
MGPAGAYGGGVSLSHGYFILADRRFYGMSVADSGSLRAARYWQWTKAFFRSFTKVEMKLYQ